MRSDFQIQASRANGSSPRSSKSVRPYPHNAEAPGSAGGQGPVTQEGKLASSRNAMKHGILSEIVLLPGEDPESFEADAADLFDEHRPVGPTEEELVEMMAVARWRRMRVWNLEKACLAGQMAKEYNAASEPRPDAVTVTALAFRALADNARTLDLVNRYESRYDRQYFRAHRRLLEIQDRRLRNEPDNTPPPPPVPEVPASCEIDSAERTQADVENTAPAAPTARRPFYLRALSSAIFSHRCPMAPSPPVPHPLWTHRETETASGFPLNTGA